ncbi:hypothetical protein RyT2_22560 [Pseudolactococcus yaeyamensis]
MNQSIVPISELSNYTKVINKVSRNSPVILTKNGYGKYAVVELEFLESLIDELNDYREKAHVYKKAFDDAYRQVEKKDEKSLSFSDYKKEKGWG